MAGHLASIQFVRTHKLCNNPRKAKVIELSPTGDLENSSSLFWSFSNLNRQIRSELFERIARTCHQKSALRNRYSRSGWSDRVVWSNPHGLNCDRIGPNSTENLDNFLPKSFDAYLTVNRRFRQLIAADDVQASYWLLDAFQSQLSG